LLHKLHIKNYRSIAEATVELRPFTMLVGANGSGKSNLLKLLVHLSTMPNGGALTKHLCLADRASGVDVTTSDGAFAFVNDRFNGGAKPKELANVSIFSIDPRYVGEAEGITPFPNVGPNGEGAIRVLDALKTGDREELFDTIERELREFVPEIEKLSFAPGGNAKSLQVREAGIPTPVPVRELSEGTRLVLTILTIVHQERPPSIVCFEDLDRGLHPALFAKVVDVCRSLARAPGAPQIVATTHNPYLVDQFIDDEDSVVLVEKAHANTSFTSLRERLDGLDRGSDTLGGIWYSGLLGGVPVSPVKHIPKMRQGKGQGLVDAPRIRVVGR
jgi:predicted ATPase